MKKYELLINELHTETIAVLKGRGNPVRLVKSAMGADAIARLLTVAVSKQKLDKRSKKIDYLDTDIDVTVNKDQIEVFGVVEILKPVRKDKKTVVA